LWPGFARTRKPPRPPCYGTPDIYTTPQRNLEVIEKPSKEPFEAPLKILAEKNLQTPAACTLNAHHSQNTL
jgi:hypothetical protein